MWPLKPLNEIKSKCIIETYPCQYGALRNKCFTARFACGFNDNTCVIEVVSLFKQSTLLYVMK